MAETPPIPPKKTQTLESIEQRLADEKKQKKQIRKQLSQTKSDLDDTKKNLIDLAEAIQENESRLADLDVRIDKLESEQQALANKLDQDHESMAGLVLAIERMQRVPPEALIVKPGAPLETAQTAMLLQGTLPAIQKRARDIAADMDRLAQVKTQLGNDRQEVQSTTKTLDRRRADMRTLIKQRERQYSRMQANLGHSEENIRQLSAQAQNLKDLLRRLAEEEEMRKQRQAAALAQRPELGNKSSRSAAPRIAAVPMPDSGSARAPVSGRLVTAFGKKDAFGAPSQGLTIETRADALIVAPMGGIIRFADDFKNYGRMVIIEHKNGYHSLLAGMARIDANVGQAVRAGEPIGILPSASSRGGTPALYYELRHNGTPVNPADKFIKIKS